MDLGLQPEGFLFINQWVKNTKRHGISQATLKYVRLDQPVRKKTGRLNAPNIVPLLGSIGLLLALIIPGIGAYRRRQKTDHRNRIIIKTL